jgi:hypothetical protein
MNNWQKTSAGLWTRTDGAKVERFKGRWMCYGPKGDLLEVRPMYAHHWDNPAKYRPYKCGSAREAMAEVDEAWPATPAKGAAR